MKHAHATSSQFLLIICDSAGSLEMQATSAFQGYRDKWITEQVKQEARQIAVSAANEKKVRRRRDSGIDKKATQQDKVQVVQHEEEEEEDGWGDEEHEQTMSQDHTARMHSLTSHDSIGMRVGNRLSLDDSTASKKRKPNPRDRRGSSASEFDGISQDYQQLAIGDRDAVTTFYMTRLRQMQQLMCKVVAKAWIKVIEPKKQSNFPYNRGDESKPNWWPADVRHKEPDHLMKPGEFFRGPRQFFRVAEFLIFFGVPLRTIDVALDDAAKPQGYHLEARGCYGRSHGPDSERAHPVAGGNIPCCETGGALRQARIAYVDRMGGGSQTLYFLIADMFQRLTRSSSLPRPRRL